MSLEVTSTYKLSTPTKVITADLRNIAMVANSLGLDNRIVTEVQTVKIEAVGGEGIVEVRMLHKERQNNG
jgi:translation initiation factor IF-2